MESSPSALLSHKFTLASVFWPMLDSHVPRFVALRGGGDKNEQTPATDNEREMPIHCACCARSSSVLEQQLASHIQPALRTITMAPAWHLLHVSWRETTYLTLT